MKFLVIGLGSMGRRRIRCLQALGYKDIVGIDPRNDRRSESLSNYSIDSYSTISDINVSDFDIMIISTPPDIHKTYLKIAIKYNKPTFVEAGVILDDAITILNTNRNDTYIAPSCTLKFHPLIKDLKHLINSKKYGKLSNFTYHSGNYLPDWHPWEKVSDFYVSNRITGGAREIVPFELTWLIDIFENPIDLKAYFQKTINMGADIEDTYLFQLKFVEGLGSVIIDVTSRFSTRSLIVNLEEAQIRWNWEENKLKVYEAENRRWVEYYQYTGEAEKGYNKNIIEQMYIDEIAAFLLGISDKSKFPNSLNDDVKILKILEKIEKSDGGFSR